MPFENNKDIACMALSPDASLLVTVDIEGRALLINFCRRILLHHHSFKTPVLDIKFSPNGKMLAVTHEKHIQIWQTPGYSREFAPFVLLKTFPGHYDAVTSLEWSRDSMYLVSGSKDYTARVFCLDPVSGIKGTVLSGHKDQV